MSTRQGAFDQIRTKSKLAMLTAYDYSTARFCEEAGIDLILVGDSLAMVFQGKPDTKSVTMEEMLYHCRAVARGAGHTIIVGDMPIDTYNTPEQALANANRFLAAGAHAIKIEGNRPQVVRSLVNEGIPVMGHIGLLPQTAESFKVQGKDSESAARFRKDAAELDEFGVFALVLECMPADLARSITAATRCRTIGIGAGPHCDGQVLVVNDMLGLYDKFRPKFVRQYAEMGTLMRKAMEQYRLDVETGNFPSADESYF